MLDVEFGVFFSAISREPAVSLDGSLDWYDAMEEMEEVRTRLNGEEKILCWPYARGGL